MKGKQGNLSVQQTKGRKTKWTKKYALLKADTKELILSDKRIKSDVISDANEKTIRRIVLHTDVTCIPVETEGKRAKRQFLLRIMSDTEDKKSAEEEEEVTLSVTTTEERDEWVKEINDVIENENDVTEKEEITVEDLDAVKVETDALNHLNKTRPKFQGRRRPQKRPSRMLEEIDENAEKKQKTDNQTDSPVKSACTDATDGASSSGLGLDSEAEVTSKGPSSSCSHDNVNDDENQSRRFKRKGKKSPTNQSPKHTEVRRRPKSDRSTSLLKRLSNRLSAVFGHGSSSTSPIDENEKCEELEASPGEVDRRKSFDSIDISEDMDEDVEGNLSKITDNAEKLLSIAKALQEDLRKGAKNSDLVQMDLKYIRRAMKHLEKSLENISLIEKKQVTLEE